jgi:hypothetical protein
MTGLQRLREVAEAATPRPWHRYGRNAVGVQTGGGNVALTDGADREGNAEHIATFDPPMVLALLDVAEAASGAAASAFALNVHEHPGMDALYAALERLREVSS